MNSIALLFCLARKVVSSRQLCVPKLLLLIAAVVVLLSLTAALAAAVPGRTIILMIGDGMGYKQVEAARNYIGSPLVMESFPVQLGCTTYMRGGGYNSSLAWSDFNYVKSGYTDSGASATALATGVKTAYARISVNHDATARLKMITEHLRDRGWSSGVVTNVPFSHATPAPFAAHNNSRNNMVAIAREMITTYGDGTGAWGNTPTVDVIIGGGHPNYASGCIGSSEYNALKAGTTGQGWTFVERQSGVSGTTSLLNAAAGATELFGLYGDTDRSIPYRLADGSGRCFENPTLVDITNASLMVLSKKPVGRFLMIEGGRIDGAGHNNNMNQLIGEMIDFDESVAAVLDWVNANDPTWSRTLLIITADHETGYLTRGSGVFPNVPLGNPGTGILPTTGVHYAWNSTAHTNMLVPVYARGAGAELLYNYATAYDAGWGVNYLDNTNIFHVMQAVYSDSSPPTIPTDVQASGFSSSMMEITWTPSSDNVAVVGYRVFRNGVQVGTADDTRYFDSGLNPTTFYSYTVSAYDGAGNMSAPSSPPAVGTTLTPCSEAPSVPTYVYAVALSQSSIGVSWTASTDNRGVLGYKVFRNGAQVGTTPTTSYTDSGLSAGTSYSYTVSAYDGDGNESAQSSPPAVGTTLSPIAISSLVPSNYVFTTFDVGSLLFIDRNFTITSMPPAFRDLKGIRTANSDKDNANLDFRFNINQPLDVYICLMDLLTPNTPLLSEFVDTGHRINTTDQTYKIWRKMYPAGQVNLGPKPGAADPEHSGRSMYFVLFDYPEDAQPPTVPTDVEATSVTETSVMLGWTPSVDNVGVAGYKIFRNGSLAGTSGTNSYLDTGLEPITTYSYTVSAFDAAGNESAQSSPATVVTTLADTEAPSVPTGVSAEALSPTEVQVSWTASTDNIGVAGYRIFRDGVAIGTSPTPGYLDDEVVSGVSYSYKVSAYDAAGNESAQSSPSVATTPDNVPPSVPSNVSATALSAVSIEIIWNASTDNVGVEGYKVFRDGELVGTTDDTSYTDIGLEPETTYSYTVSAYDAVSNESQQSSPAVATTESAVSISEAKLLDDYSTVTLVSKIVSAVFDDFFYVKQPDDYVGIRVVPTEMPEGLSVKNTVDITGVLLTSVMSNERYIDGDVMIKY